MHALFAMAASAICNLANEVRLVFETAAQRNLAALKSCNRVTVHSKGPTSFDCIFGPIVYTGSHNKEVGYGWWAATAGSSCWSNTGLKS